jgi:hypothetical protein
MNINGIEIKGCRSADPGGNVCNGCPCTYTNESEIISNYGCLPDGIDLVRMYLENKGHWKCHSKDRKCGGLTHVLKENKIPFNKNNELLITEDNPLIEGETL